MAGGRPGLRATSGVQTKILEPVTPTPKDDALAATHSLCIANPAVHRGRAAVVRGDHLDFWGPSIEMAFHGVHRMYRVVNHAGDELSLRLPHVHPYREGHEHQGDNGRGEESDLKLVEKLD
ncbi:MAG: hypothetical protein K6T83_21420 [Alicyclobacillus sp.]|nr:hypothetical protein [Alicyclobacillus sp.]